ncbi:MAG: hemopexin repeat-containing protein, partial [Actinomycetes bacterium]
HTYLFSGDQFVRYTGTDYATVDSGYPRRLSALAQEPRFAALTGTLTGVDAAFADRGTIYLVSSGQVHAVSTATYRRYDRLALDQVECAFLDGGKVLVEHPDGWHHYSALERATITAPADRPRPLRTVPLEFRTGLDAVLTGHDGNVYLFKGATCFNTRLDREYPLAEEWGRPRNNVYHDNTVDAAFVGVDGKTYVFSGDQFVVYNGLDCVDALVEGGPRSIAEHWGGLTSVALAYVRDGVTYLFEPPNDSGTMRCLVYSGKGYQQPDGGQPGLAGPDFWGIPAPYLPDGFTRPDAVLFAGATMLILTGDQFLQYDEAGDIWAYPRPLERIWRGIGTAGGLTTAFTGRDGATYFFFGDEFTRYSARVFAPRRPVREHWGLTGNNFLGSGDDIVDAAVAFGEHTYL